MDYLEQAQALHRQTTVVDAHHDILMDVLHRRERRQRGVLSGHWGPPIAAAGVNVQVLPVYIDDMLLPEMGLRRILQMLEGGITDLREDGSLLQLATSIAEVDAALADGKIAAVLALEGTDGLSGDPALLRTLYYLGVRMVGLTWNRRTGFADGLAEDPGGGGLSKAGKQAIREMNEYGIIPDVSHLSVKSFWDVAEICEGPFVASHSNAIGVHDNKRNLDDDQLKAIAAHNGVVGLNFVGDFIAEVATVGKLADHLDYIASLIGIEHIGLGPDFLEDWLLDSVKFWQADLLPDPSILDHWIEDCRRVEQLPVFTAELLRRGMAEANIAQVLGGNFMRVFREVWK